MALKAGRVGVKSSLVDEYGNIKGMAVDIEERLDDVEELTANIDENLTANEKTFVFAYDENSQKYGYKAGIDGEFKPFSSGGSSIGRLFPLDVASTEGLTYGNNIELVEGGYYIADNKCYMDITLKATGNNNSDVVLNIPAHTSYSITFLRFVNTADATNLNTNTRNIGAGGTLTANTVVRYIGIYNI